MAYRKEQYAKITGEQIVACRDLLRPEHVAVLCAAGDGAGYVAMAAALGLKVGTVKSRLNRARAALALARSKRFVHPNGKPMYALDGTLLDEKGNRSIFDDVDA